MGELIFIKLMTYFLENPYQEVYLRQLSKKLKLSTFATKKYADLLIKEDLIGEERKANLRYLKPNINNLFFKQLKISLSISKILRSGLIPFLHENVANISSIVLFGSMAKGEDDEKSDMDMVIIGKCKNLDLNKFESDIGREINLHIFGWGEWNKQAKNNKAFYYDVIIYGIPLYGEIPVIK